MEGDTESDVARSQSLIHQVSVSDLDFIYYEYRRRKKSQSLIHQVSVSDNTDPFGEYELEDWSQSLIHQVSVSELKEEDGRSVHYLRLNPLFIRSQFQMVLQILERNTQLMSLNPLFIRSQFQMIFISGFVPLLLERVSIPYSSGLSFRC